MSTLIESMLSTVWQCLKNKTGLYKYKFGPSNERSTAGQVKEFPGRLPHAHSVIVQRTFCPFLIWYIFVLSVIHLLNVR